MSDEDGPLPGGRHPGERWESAVERKIRQATERGEFDNLPGAGKPLKFDDNPLLDPSWRPAINLLKANGYSHPGIEAKRALEQEVERARRQDRPGWRDEVNRKIRTHNLSWREPFLHLTLIKD